MENSNDRWVPDNPPIQGTFREEPLGDRKGRPYALYRRGRALPGPAGSRPPRLRGGWQNCRFLGNFDWGSSFFTPPGPYNGCTQNSNLCAFRRGAILHFVHRRRVFLQNIVKSYKE